MKRINEFGGISFDEAIASSVSGSETIERPVNHRVFYYVIFLVLFSAIIAAFRVFAIGYFGYDFYSARASSNINREIITVSPRGIIVDRFGKPLVGNDLVFSAFLKVSDMVRNNEKEFVLGAAIEILNISEEEIQDKLDRANLEKNTDILLAQDIRREKAIKLQSLNLTSLYIENDFKRKYLDEAFSHIVGYVGLPNKADLLRDPKLSLIDVIGRAGLEASYNEYMRGESGRKVVYKNAVEVTQEVKDIEEAKPGQTLKTTIDAELQKYFYEELYSRTKAKGQSAGVGIALNPQNGEILSLISLPSFDANNLGKYLSSPNQPLFNRAISGSYNPASTIKPLHAIAALNEGVIDTNLQIFSRGYIEVPNPYNPDFPSRFVDWKPHNWVDIYSAMAKSSNIFFYASIGGLPSSENHILKGKGKISGVGIKKINEYWQKFGLNFQTGIDLPGEGKSFLPTPEEKGKRTKQIWRIGDTYNISIGQGDLSITPIQLANYFASIANKGPVYKPHIADLDKSEMMFDLSEFADEMKEVERGMMDSVYKSYGTSFSMSDLPMKIAAKTGSAQTNFNSKTNALFVGYGPVSAMESPEILILVLIEDAKEGSLNAIPIAKNVLNWYYENRLAPKKAETIPDTP